MTCEKFINSYLEKGLLKTQKCDFKTAEKFIFRAQKELKTAESIIDIDEDTSYTTAYSAMLHAGRAFMLSKGYRPDDGQQHKTVCEFTSEFLGEEYKIIVKKFDEMRKKRNNLVYDISISVSKTEATNVLNMAKAFIELIAGILKKENPQIKFDF